MSDAGILSNRGDVYQKLVALSWALTVLDDSGYQWLEADSVTFDVDDIVICRTNGSLICCQCKKNQPDFKAWSLADLSDELNKAYSLLEKNKNVEIRFYSRDSFGKLAKLREYSIIQPDKNNYYTKLPKNLQETDTELGQQLTSHALDISSYEFISRTTFETTPDFPEMKDLLHNRLRSVVSSSDAVYNALWVCLDQLGARITGDKVSASSQHRLTKTDLMDVVRRAGGVLSPRIDSEVVRKSFASTSSIGRSWRRDIAGHSLARPVLDELLSAIDDKHEAILLTGLPGSGKTCVMLSLQEALEQRAKTDSNIIPLFIQSREFADFVTVEERSGQGLPKQWVEDAARLAEDAHLIVVIDSLDVLSIAREHKILTYFLAQLDRLLGIPNITVITACRDFDRKYDSRIAERKWDCELKCGPLDWDTEVKPLIEAINIDSSSIESGTRELIRNPRELALFVELVKSGDRCNVVTSQTLAQLYIDIFIRKDPELGDDALKAIEKMAEEMLKVRRLNIPHQRISISATIKQRLCSLNIIQETQRRELTFGHQTLLDVLVISGAFRKGNTLNEFIQDLPSVPFVRPCIRSFIQQLVLGDRQEYRKQLRTVLTGNGAFHIRRLVAESLSEQIPLDEDWSLLRDLRNNHGEVFQVIYNHARRIEWHYLWIGHLVPILFDTRDAEGLSVHLSRTSLWGKEDPSGVLTFWTKLMQFDYINKDQLIWPLSSLLKDMDDEYIEQAAPLLEKLIDLPRPEYSPLGSAIARYVSAGVISDIKLWQYIAGGISDEDVLEYGFFNKLHCQPYEFGDKKEDFLNIRMVQSVALLDIAICSIEKWSQIKSLDYGIIDREHCFHFLDTTSYHKAHSRRDHDHEKSANVLFNAVEQAIIHHAQAQSEWWELNSRRLCFNHESALRYFGIFACTANPQTNIELIGCLLADKKMLESRLSYELGVLARNAFIYLDSNTQDTIIEATLSIHKDRLKDERNYQWVLQERSSFISFIPCYLRSPEAQSVLDEYESKNGIMVSRPAITSSCGTVQSPFSYDKFIQVGDDAVLQLINHYSGYDRTFDDFLIGGETQVRSQLREAASRQPTRFLKMLSTNWNDIPCRFRDNIMDGIASHLTYRCGKLRADNDWKPLESPDGSVLANHIIDELERHSNHWHHNRAASSAIESCSHVINDTSNATRLIFLCSDYVNYQEERINETGDLIQAGINMTSGHVAEAVIILANTLLDNNIDLPELLSPTLLRFARSKYKAHKALIFRRLAYFQSKRYDLGWEVFHVAMECPTGLWEHAESCLYYAYRNHFDIVAPILNQIYNEACGEELKVWGRISALASLSDLMKQSTLLKDLRDKDSVDAWRGAANVWTNSENIKQFREQCLTGIEAGLKENIIHASAVADEMAGLFHNDSIMILIPIELMRRYFNVLENDAEDKNQRLFGIDEWLREASQHDPMHALTVTEMYIDHIIKLKLNLHDYHNNYTQLMTRLFAEAEEREEADNGEMLQRVVSLQDKLLARGVNGINDWLKAAERP